MIAHQPASAFRSVFQERRVAVRRAIDATTQVATLETRRPEHAVATFVARVLDVSPTGMRIRTETALRPGDQHWFRIELPGERSFRVRGQVAWTREAATQGGGFAIGIVFLAMPEERTRRLRRWLGD